ncbi:MAG TPA: hypothetical protein VMF52_02330 [Steroidobacteraceae bacterium]|nr:hypothetical protein [Steroidobacteraceae bacterium]
MSGRKDIEARLDRSLQNQVRVPRLDASFDAAVWARIEAEESRATNPAATATPSRAQRASRWLAISNSIGIAVTLGVALYFLLRTFGVDAPAVNLDVNVPMPAISEDTVTQIVTALGQVLGVVALVFGLSFTAIGRRVRASFS